MRLLVSLQKNRTVYLLTLRNMVVGRRGGAWLKAALRESTRIAGALSREHDAQVLHPMNSRMQETTQSQKA
jgi:hypothetical protein